MRLVLSATELKKRMNERIDEGAIQVKLLDRSFFLIFVT